MWWSDSGEISGLCCLLKENCSRVLKTISQNAAVENQNSCLTSSDSCYGPYKGINNLDIKQRLLPVIKVWYRSAQLGHVTSLHGPMPEWRITEKNGDLLVSVKKAWCCGEGKAEQGLEMSWEKLEAIYAVLQDIHLTPCFLVFFYYLHFIHMYICMSSWDPLCLQNVSVGCCAAVNGKSWVLVLAEFLALNVSDGASQPRKNLLLSWVRRHLDSLILQICIKQLPLFRDTGEEDYTPW